MKRTPDLLFAPEAAAAAARAGLPDLPIGPHDRAIKVGPFTVRRRPFCPRSPYTVYTITWGGHVVGAQISYPTEADCVTHARITCELGRIDSATLKAIRQQAGAGTWLHVPLKSKNRGVSDDERRNRERTARAQARTNRIRAAGEKRCDDCGPKPLKNFRESRPGYWLNVCLACESIRQKQRKTAARAANPIRKSA